MARNHFLTPFVPDAAYDTVRLGSAAGAANNLDYKEVGKFVKLAGDSQYNLCAAGDAIEAVIAAVELANQNDWTIGSILKKGRLSVVFDGLQATPGTGTIAVGDFVVAGTVVAKGTALTTYPKVCKATAQTAAPFMWRVVSLGTGGVGTVGGIGVIERVVG